MAVLQTRKAPVNFAAEHMWTSLSASEQLDQLLIDSQLAPQLVFKHSTRCSISRVALSRFDRMSPPGLSSKYYLLDLLQFRSLSQAITERYEITHESPQVLVIRFGKCIYHANHLDIEPIEIFKVMTAGGSESL